MDLETWHKNQPNLILNSLGQLSNLTQLLMSQIKSRLFLNSLNSKINVKDEIDTIVFSQVMEHVYDPKGFCKKYI